MPFGMPFYYCGKTVHSFSDVAAAPSPMLEAAATSFAPVLLSLESWTPHAYLGTVLQLTVHVVNDDDAGADLGPTTVSVALECEARCPATARGQLPVPAVPYYSAHSAPLAIRLPLELPAGCDHTTCTILASLAPTTVAKPACVDVPGWTDVYAHSCDAYEHDGHCRDGAFVRGHEWARGARWNHPESNCCACNAKLGQAQAAAASADASAPLAVAHPEPITLFVPLPPEVAVVPVAVYDGPEGATLAALRRSGLAVSALGSMEALEALPAAEPVVVGESLRGGWSNGRLVRALRARLAAGGRVLLLQQSGAPDWDDAVVRDLLDDALRILPPTVTLPHSGRTLHRGEPVHPQRPEHALFRTPHALNASWWESWNLLEPWEPKVAQPAGGRRLPHPSPMSSALTLDVSSAAPDAIAANAAALRRMQPLLTHAMGSAGLVLTEVFFPPPSSGVGRGVALACGLGLVARAARDPVADRVLRNLAAYLRAAAPPAPHPLFVPGEVIEWGRNFSSERGVAYSAPSGLVVQPCSYSKDCLEWPGGLGMPACGMLPTGPFDWTWMGHNRDLNPQSKTGWASLTFRTTAATLTTRFQVTQWDDKDTPALPSVEMQLLAENFEVAASAPCVSRWADGAPEATCGLGVLDCRDDMGWTNGQGKTCADYSSERWCAGGGAVPGAEWTLGSQFGRPEDHCCACGKRAGPSTQPVVRHVTMRVVGPKTTALTHTFFR